MYRQWLIIDADKSTRVRPLNQSLQHKVAVIVGSSSGMGRATALAFAAAGARVVLAARNKMELDAVASRIGDAASVCVTDVGDSRAVENLISTTIAALGRIDILVYATGTNIPERSLDALTSDTWDMMVATNLTGAFYCTKAVVPVMRKQNGGLIIYVSSVCVQKPDVSGVSYQATKHGMTGLAHGTFAEEQKNGIRTSIIFPGLTDTPMVLKRPTPTPAEMMAVALQPEDIAEACLFVAALPSRTRVPELVLAPAGL